MCLGVVGASETGVFGTSTVYMRAQKAITMDDLCSSNNCIFSAANRRLDHSANDQALTQRALFVGGVS